jgi:hypothetical protein
VSCSDRETKRRADHKAARLRAWKSTGSLYSEQAEAHLLRQIRAAFTVEFGPVAERTEAPADVMEPSEEHTARVGDAHIHAMTLDEVGAVLRLSGERVRQIELKALAKMKCALERIEAGLAPRGRS